MSTEPLVPSEPDQRAPARRAWPLVLQAVTLVVAVVALVFALIAFNRTQPAHHGRDRRTQTVTTSPTPVTVTPTPSGT